MSDDDLIRRGDALHLVEDYETIHDRMSLLPAVVQETTAAIRELEAERTKDHAEINLKADFIDATLNQLAAADAKVARLEAPDAVGALVKAPSWAESHDLCARCEEALAALTEGDTTNE